MKKKRLIVLSVITICLVTTVLYLLYYFNYIPHKKYNNEYFNIKTYISDIDKDNDGIDDQTDILINAREYIIVVVILMMNMGFALMWLLLLLRMQDMI